MIEDNFTFTSVEDNFLLNIDSYMDNIFVYLNI